MKILVVGGTGTIGSKVVNRLSQTDEVITVGSTSGDLQADITDPESITSLFEEVGKVDAVITTVGSAPVKPLADSSNDDFMEGVKSKMMGQINVALTAMDYLNENGSVTVTSGILADDPIPQGTILSTVNGALNGFVTGAYGEFLQRGFRINGVSPALVEDSAEALGDFFPGHTPAPMDDVVDGYVKSVKTLISGQIIDIE
jgi:NAD(P)-dependent dehydrogenase (short-subunit alcohol dehydrogenase family)